jgi:preprotein translocase YajC subunit
MPFYSILYAIGAPPSGEQANPLGTVFLMTSMFLIVWFVLLRPSEAKRKKLETVVAALKPRDKILVNPGIFAEVVSLEEHRLLVRVDANTKIWILKTAVAGMQDQAAETESK